MRHAVLSLTLLLASCGTDPVDLTLDVVSDWVPGLDFTAATVELSRSPFDAAELGEVQQETLSVTGTEDFLRGVRVAEITNIGLGRRFVRVSLRSASGAAIATRVIDLTLERSFAATVLLTRSCQSVECPAPAGTPELSECQAGECVDPRCSPSTPEYCAITPCEDADDCTIALEWCDGEPVCRAGGCLCDDAPEPADTGIPDAGPADTGGMDTGAPDTSVPDTGPPCPATETACTDGMDDDCDTLVDCADPDCRGASCDDGFFCTTNDRCGADGACSDTTATCPRFCNESSGSCEECTSNADCGSVSYGSWSACGGFSGTCDQGGTRSRSVMTPTCNAGACTVASSSQSEACSRSTNGVSCGSTTTGSWGGCGGFSNACDTTGTQSRTITTRTCSGGSCASQNSSESRGCNRTVANGTGCGSTFWHGCCGGTCVDFRNNNSHCGACNVNCPAIGGSCATVPGRGYACTCGASPACKTELNNDATCYNTNGQSVCNCQCPGLVGGVVCANGGCGPGFYCYDCNGGHNVCAPFAGSCG